jgi:hypothetical protein
MNRWTRPYTRNGGVQPQALKLFPWAWLFLFLPFLAACAANPLAVDPTPEISRFQAAPEFEAIYQDLGGADILGEPITIAVELSESNLLVQYFQAARMEYDPAPGLTEAERLRFYPLGEWALAGLNRRQPWPEPATTPTRYFSETDQSVQGEFLAFYEAHQGERWLGPPISPPLDRDGRRVQYFLNGRLDWHPELPDEQQVRAGFLGQAHFDAEMSFFYPRALSQQFIPANSVTEVDVFAAVRYPVLYSGDQQLLYVTILAPDGRAVSGLNVLIEYDNGQTSRRVEMRVAEGQNMVQVPIDAQEWLPGQSADLRVSVISSRGSLLGQDNLTFQTWW